MNSQHDSTPNQITSPLQHYPTGESESTTEHSQDPQSIPLQDQSLITTTLSIAPTTRSTTSKSTLPNPSANVDDSYLSEDEFLQFFGSSHQIQDQPTTQLQLSDPYQQPSNPFDLVQLDQIVQPTNNLPECPICRDAISTPTMPSSCQHIYCSSCIGNWTDNDSACPVCKQRIYALHQYELNSFCEYMNDRELTEIGNRYDDGQPLTHLFLSEFELPKTRLNLVNLAHHSPPPSPIYSKKVKRRVQNQYNDDMTLNPYATALENTTCYVCGLDDEEPLFDENGEMILNDILLCDGHDELCTRGCHFRCHDPPLASLPDENWFCPDHAALYQTPPTLYTWAKWIDHSHYLTQIEQIKDDQLKLEKMSEFSAALMQVEEDRQNGLDINLITTSDSDQCESEDDECQVTPKPRSRYLNRQQQNTSPLRQKRIINDSETSASNTPVKKPIPHHPPKQSNLKNSKVSSFIQPQSTRGTKLPISRINNMKKNGKQHRTISSKFIQTDDDDGDDDDDDQTDDDDDDDDQTGDDDCDYIRVFPTANRHTTYNKELPPTRSTLSHAKPSYSSTDKPVQPLLLNNRNQLSSSKLNHHSTTSFDNNSIQNTHNNYNSSHGIKRLNTYTDVDHKKPLENRNELYNIYKRNRGCSVNNPNPTQPNRRIQGEIENEQLRQRIVAQKNQNEPQTINPPKTVISRAFYNSTLYRNQHSQQTPMPQQHQQQFISSSPPQQQSNMVSQQSNVVSQLDNLIDLTADDSTAAPQPTQHKHPSVSSWTTRPSSHYYPTPTISQQTFIPHNVQPVINNRFIHTPYAHSSTPIRPNPLLFPPSFPPKKLSLFGTQPPNNTAPKSSDVNGFRHLK